MSRKDFFVLGKYLLLRFGLSCLIGLVAVAIYFATKSIRIDNIITVGVWIIVPVGLGFLLSRLNIWNHSDHN